MSFNFDIARRNASMNGLEGIPLFLTQNCSFYFGANTADWVVNNYPLEVGDGNLTRTAVSQITGIIDEGLNLNALNSNSVFGDSTLQNYAGLQFHESNIDVDYFISFWVYRNTATTGYLFDFRNATPRSGVVVLFRGAPNNDLFFAQEGINGGGSAVSRSSSRPENIVPLNAWSHIVLSYNSSTKLDKVWVDSVLKTGETYTDNGYLNKNGTSQTVAIGASLNNSLVFDGAEDEFSAYKGVQATQEIVDYLYNGGVGNAFPFN